MGAKRFTADHFTQVLIVAALLLGHAGAALGHETDQYTPAVGRDYADLGPYLSRVFRAAIVDAVAETNAAILAAPTEDRSGLPAEDTQSADYIAASVWKHLFIAMPLNEGLDAQLASAPFGARFPGLVTLHWPPHSVYNDPLLLIDPTKTVRALFRAGTISVGGTLIGTDKIIHFINLGRIYHAAYVTRVGVPPAQAAAETVASINANPLYSEEGMLGYLTTGIRSNADLAANFAGLAFYRNLTEEVRIGGRLLPPMLSREGRAGRDGRLWRVDLPPDTDFVAAFVTPHWNEVLNPNRYLDYVAERMRPLLRERCPAVFEAYRDRHGRSLDREGFAATERGLATYFGEDYGYADSKGVSVAAICFEPGAATTLAAPALPASPASPTGAPSDRDALGRTPLWWAAHDGDAAEIDRLLALGADPDAADVDAETPLHASARNGDLLAVRSPLARGAQPNRASLAGQTPLMIAAARGQVAIVAELLHAGADPALRGPFGMTALHEAVLRGNAESVTLLLAAGAQAAATNDAGNTSLHLAGGAGDDALVEVLLAHGAAPTARNANGDTPVDVANRQGHARTARRLAARSASDTGLALAPTPTPTAASLMAPGVPSDPDATPAAQPTGAKRNDHAN